MLNNITLCPSFILLIDAVLTTTPNIYSRGLQANQDHRKARSRDPRHLSSMPERLPRPRSHFNVAVAEVEALRARRRLEVGQRGTEEAGGVQGAGKDVYEGLFFERKAQVGSGRA